MITRVKDLNLFKLLNKLYIPNLMKFSFSKHYLIQNSFKKFSDKCVKPPESEVNVCENGNTNAIEIAQTDEIQSTSGTNDSTDIHINCIFFINFLYH